MRSVSQRIHVTEEWISSYAHSIEAPLQTMQGKLIAPATMPIIFWQEFEIPWLEQDTTYIHGSQRFSYIAPVISGMVLDCELTLSKQETKSGRSGQLTFLHHTLVCAYEGEVVVTAETVLIQVGDSHEKNHIG